MDFFAYRSQLDERGVGAEEPDCFEYWQGMRVMKYIEEGYGLKSVLNFLRSGDISQATSGKIRNLDHLYEVSQLKGFLVNAGRDAANQRLVPMFSGLDLNYPENLIRVSAWLKFRDQCLEFEELPPRGKDRDGKSESDQGYLVRLECLFAQQTVSIRTLLSITQFRDGGAVKILTDGGLGDHVSCADSWDISLFLACHLKSTPSKSTASMLNPIMEWIRQSLKKATNTV